MKKYVAADVHAAMTTFCVRGEEGRIEMRSVVQTQASPLLTFVRAIPGEVHLTFEEGTHAAWLYDLFRPYVAKLVVCNPRHNRLLEGSKSDDIDPEKLSELLRGGFVKPVYHGEHGTRRLKDLVRARHELVGDRTRVKNRLKAFFRSRGIATSEASFYDPGYREAWLAKLDLSGLRERCAWLYRELDCLVELSGEAEAAVRAESRRHQAWKLLKTIPGIGELRAAEIVAEVVTPFRFRTKRQFWSYCGFDVVKRSSDDYRQVGGRIVKRRHALTRGLSNEYNRRLKRVFKAAALDAYTRGEFNDFVAQRVDEGMREEMARLTLARKLAAIALATWKKGERYDSSKGLMRLT